MAIAIGFDLPVQRQARSNAIHLLDAAYEILTRRGASSAELVAVGFPAGACSIEVLTRTHSRSHDYPDLITILGQLGQTCVDESIEAHRLRRIAFLDDEIGLELIDADGEPEVYVFPIRPLSYNA
jgi:hypothetical protein